MNVAVKKSISILIPDETTKDMQSVVKPNAINFIGFLVLSVLEQATEVNRMMLTSPTPIKSNPKYFNWTSQYHALIDKKVSLKYNVLST